MPQRPLGRRLAIATLIASTLSISACASRAPDATATTATTAPATTATTATGTADHAEGAHALPSTHVHGVGRDPGDGALLVATHDGLYRYQADGPRRVSPPIDLMGFTIAGPVHYYASGHPNTVMDLPQPLGLAESRDGGRTWTVLSRGGTSDFHALAKAGDTVVAFDGQLRRTVDGRAWSVAAIPAEPRVLASSPAGRNLLATTETGLLASTDRGATWTLVPGAPLLLLVAWADEQTAVGVAPDGTVAISRDAAKTWRTSGRTEPAPQALSASMSAGQLEILVVTEHGVLSSTDGASFTTAAPQL
ncbi:F510_1955 family glycosylhydrolase [Phycicoccus sp. SLBN-51]|uniref:F510_1955 family glycosylhydrolase n=1 Tax=Phycicoccus sp. SLBN-51 TaxID=2768447 RepID=UPI00116ADA25|nr:exo-alpha-sialidase [Phycicoccus sp. SLBN-51]TQJ49294.1 photosystem II stability/assembly factor-like uncharacterized protein [Phycicoccus sp. SLBN-51]